MTVVAPPLDTAGAELDRFIAVVQALVGTTTRSIASADNVNWTADNVTITADAFFSQNLTALWQYEQLLNQLQVEAVDHYMVTGWLNAAAILAQYAPPPAWDERGQELQARVTYLSALVANPPAPPPGNASGYGGSGWVTVLQNYQQQLYEAQITLVEHMMDIPGGTTAATMLANMTGTQSFPFQYTSSGTLPTFPNLPTPPPPLPPPPPPPPSSHRVGGTLSGMSAGSSIVLQNNGGDNLTVSANGSFLFATPLLISTPYSVTVLTPPPGQLVTLANASGFVGGVDVTDVGVSCGAAALHSVGGTLSGLAGAGPIVLQNNNTDDLPLSSNGGFTFPTKLTLGQPYSVRVFSAPPAQNVTVTNAAGTIAGNVTNVAVNAAAPATYFVGGTLSGLTAGQSIVLRNNGADDLTLTANGSFQFATKIASGVAYSVSVLTTPTTETVAVLNGSGFVGNANVTAPAVTCTPFPTFSVGGTVSGLSGGGSLILQNNGGDNLTINANGAFSFPAKLLAGASYVVTVLTNPANENTTVTNGSGTMPAANVTGVGVACIPFPTYSVGGTLTGLAAGQSIVLQDNGGNNLTVSANGAFTFTNKLFAGAAYAVTVLTQPVDGSTCTLTNASGVMPSANVTNVGAAVVGPPHYTVGGTLSGLAAGTFVVLQNNGGDDLTLNANGAFTFVTGLLAAASYAVTVLTQPAGGTCTLSNDTGTMGSANVTNVGAVCVVAPRYTIGGTLSGLPAGNTIVLQNNAGDNLTLSANGSFVFATPLLAAAAYAVTILTQPVDGTCTLTNASGTVGSANVTNVGAAVVPFTYSVGGTLSGLAAGTTISLQNNGGNTKTLSANGAFTFTTKLAKGAAYAVTVLTPPSGETVALTNATGTMPAANVTNVSVVCAPAGAIVRRFQPGIYIAIAYADRGLGPNGDTLSADTGTFSYAAGTTSVPLTITGNYSSGTIPGGKNGTGTTTGCSKGTGTGGHTMNRTTSGPCIYQDATHRVVGVMPRYPWADIEPTKNNFNFTQMDADLAQCISLGVMWVPMFVDKIFTASEASGDPIPAYMQPYRYHSGTDYLVWRWDLVNVVPNTTRVLAKIAARYDLCPNFGGVATQETATFNADTSATNWHSGDYLTALSANSDALASASPNSRHWAFNNFGGNEGPVMLDRYAAYIQKNGAVLCMPDTTLCSNGVYGSCYTSGSGVQAGRYSGYHFGGVIGSGVNFSSTGPVAGSIQRAEWIGIGPACLAGQTVQNTTDYLLASTTVGVQPNFLNGQAMIMDWHQGAGSPNNQQFTPDGVNLIKNNAISRFNTWVIT